MKFLLITLLIFSSNLFAQNYKQVKIYINELEDVNKLFSIGLEFDHFSQTKDGAIETFISFDEFQLLKNSSFQFEVMIEDWFSYYENLPKLQDYEKNNFVLESKNNFGVEGFGFGSMGGYYTYAEIVANMDSMHAQFPNIITPKFSIGTSHLGRTIWAMKISDNPNQNENEPQVEYDALIHSREPQSMATLLYFMWYLLENYGTDPEVTYLVNNRELFFVPCYNPDGYEKNRQTNPNGGGMWRKNRRNNSESDGVDLNRNYSFQWGFDNSGSSPTPSSDTYRGPSPFSEPETQAVSNFIISKNIKTSLNMHSYWNAYLYPWGYINQACPDEQIYIEYCTDMTSYNNFVFGTGNQVLGYNSNGSARDWLYGEQTVKNKIFGYTMEIGSSADGFWPPQNRIFPIAQINVRPNLYNAWVAGEYVHLHNTNIQQQYFNPGDNILFSPTLRNKGLSSAKNFTVTLTSLSDKATVTNSVTQIDSIPSRENRTSPTALGFNINQNVIAEERIKLLLTYSTNGDVMKSDTLEFIIGEPFYSFIDTTNNINSLWTVTATPTTPSWGTTTSTFYSGPNSYTDSPTGQYVNNATVILSSTNNILLTGQNPRLTFWTKFDIESNYDYGQVEISTNNGTTWTPLWGLYSEPGVGNFQPNGEPVYDGTRLNWIREEISLAQYSGQQVKIRFKLRTDGVVTRDGWYIDDIGIYNFAIVPVELVSFTANVNENNIILNWSTASEMNNLGFEIQRSAFSNERSVWKVLGFVNGNGTTIEFNNYSFTDNILMERPYGLKGKYSYRLKQIDLDGSFQYSNIIDVELGLPNKFALLQNYPNPFNPSTIIEYHLPSPLKGEGSWVRFVSLKVYDMLGNEVATLVNEYQSAGSYNINFNGSNLSSGVYYYTLRAVPSTSSGQVFVESKKMILIK